MVLHATKLAIIMRANWNSFSLAVFFLWHWCTRPLWASLAPTLGGILFLLCRRHTHTAPAWCQHHCFELIWAAESSGHFDHWLKRDFLTFVLCRQSLQVDISAKLLMADREACIVFRTFPQNSLSYQHFPVDVLYRGHTGGGLSPAWSPYRSYTGDVTGWLLNSSHH